MTNTKKRWLWVFVLLLITCSIGAYFFLLDSAQKAESALQTTLVERGTIEDSISAQGTLEPKDYVDVGVQVSGQIKKLYVDIGDQVKEGQILAELDPRSYESMVLSNQAQIKALDAQIKQEKAKADYARLRLNRSLKLLKNKAISQEDYEEKNKELQVSEATIESLEAQKEQAQANLESNQINLGYTKIYSPMDGIVSDRSANEGQTLNANQTTPTILQVANLNVMTVRAELAEADVMRIKAGMESTFSTLGNVNQKWKGTIRQVLPTPIVVNDVVLYNALIDVDNKNGDLFNGMSTQNSFIVEKAVDVLVIPPSSLAVRLEDKDTDQGQAYLVYVLKNKKIESREVFVGLMTRTQAEIKSGLTLGESVITSTLPEDMTTKKNGGPPMMGARL